MQGINYVANEDGERVAVLIDLRKNGELWEDFYDGLTAKQREKETRQSIEDIKKSLTARGKLRG